MKPQAFFLPTETRPAHFPPLTKMVGKFWHAGIIYREKVYECFDQGRYSVSDFDEQKKQQLVSQNAVFIEINADEDKVLTEINSGTDCSEYVARVVGMSKNTGSKKEYWPEEVYQFILKAKSI